MTKQVFKPLALAAAVSAASLGYTGKAVSATVATSDLGDLALVPYYMVGRGPGGSVSSVVSGEDWVTGIHIVNTSDHTQVVKVRFRRATDGMDAMDFNIVMSPKDVYAGYIYKDNNSKIYWTSTDTTCTVPLKKFDPVQNRDVHAMQPTYRKGADSGYVEIIAMGQPVDEDQPIAVAAKHVKQSDNTFKPLDCKAVFDNFEPDGRTAAPTAVPPVAGRLGVAANNFTFQPGRASTNPIVRIGGNNEYVDSGNVLKVSYFIRHNDSGIEFGDNAVHIKDFLDLPSMSNQKYGIFHGDLNGYDFPDLDGTGLPRRAVVGTTPGSIQRGRFNLLRRTSVLGATSIINDWSVNPANGVEMDWVVTLPGQYLMLGLQRYFDSLGADRDWVPTVSRAGSPVENPKCPRTPTPVGTIPFVASCDYRDQPLELTYDAYNREEFKGEVDTGTLVVSPAPPIASATTYLPKVANVITFGGKSVLGQSDANVNADLGEPYGWVQARLTSRPNLNVCGWRSTEDLSPPNRGRPPASSLPTARCTPATGRVPVIGFAAWSRNVAANPDASYGRIVEHSYTS